MVKETDRFIDNGVYARKDKLGWRLIFPPKNLDGSKNWFNILTGGSWENLIKTIIVVSFLMVLIWLYKHDTATLVECCNSCKQTAINVSKWVMYP